MTKNCQEIVPQCKLQANKVLPIKKKGARMAVMWPTKIKIAKEVHIEEGAKAAKIHIPVVDGTV